MFERFTKEAKGLVLRAIDHAEQRDDRRVRTEHLLLAAAEVSPLLDHQILDAELKRFDSEALRLVGIDPDLADLDPRRPPMKRRQHLPFTNEAKKVLTNSLRETLDRGDRRIGITHILLALTTLDPGDRAIKAMSASGVDPSQLRESLLGRIAS